MYELRLTESYVPAQPDGTLVDFSVGDLLRSQAAALPNTVAVTAMAAALNSACADDRATGCGTKLEAATVVPPTTMK